MHRERASTDVLARRLGVAALVMAAATLVTGLVTSPPDHIQGQSVRLMYVHVPAAWTAFAAFGVVALASTCVLLGGGSRMDALARAAAELGVGMTALTLAEGSIWGHVAWGVWWTWDPRIVTTALLLLVYLAYLGMRALPGPPAVVRRRAAILGALGVIQVGVVHFSVLWWRTLHQPPTLLRPSLHDPIAGSMAIALVCGVLASTLAGAWFVRRRYRQLVDEPPSIELRPPVEKSVVSTAIAPGHPGQAVDRDPVRSGP